MQVNQRIRTAVSVLIVIGISSVWLYQSLNDQSANPAFAAVVLLYGLAAGYVVFGKRAFDEAKQTYEEVRDGDSNSEGESEESE